LCGLVGERTFALLDQDTNKPDFYRIKNVVLATFMIEFIENVSSNDIELMVYGGKQDSASYGACFSTT